MIFGQLFPIAIALFISLGSALLLMPLGISLGKRFKLVSKPRLFGKGRKSVPYLGGAAVAISVALACLVGLGPRTDMAALLAGGALILVLGTLDDRMNKVSLSPWLRLFLQSSIVGVAWSVGLGSDTGGLLGAAGTILFVVAAMNAFNLLDNMDGVAGWTGAATAGSICGLALFLGQRPLAVVSAGIGGACLGFLRYNFPQGRIYLGNGGSMLLGFLIGTSALELQIPLSPPWGFLAVVLLLGVGVTDTAVAIVSRLLHGKPIMRGATDHISHRLVRLGIGKRKAALVHGLAAAGTGGVVTAAAAFEKPALLGLAAAVLALAGLWLLTVRVYPDEGRNKIRRLALAASLLVPAAVALAVPSVLAAKTNLQQANRLMAEGLAAVQGLDFAAAEKSFARAEHRVLAARGELNSPMTWGAAVLPISRGNIETARSLAEGSSYLVPAAREGARALATVAGADGQGGVTFANGQLSIDPINNAGKHLESALRGARLGLASVGDEPGALLPPLAEARTQFVEQSRAAVESLEKARGIYKVLPKMMGSEGPRTYFLMIENPTERRGTGGLLGAFGIMRADKGKLTLERFDSNLSLPEGPEIPWPNREISWRYERFNSQRLWQNVNMTPDFPTAGAMVAKMWETRTGQTVDGVLAVDGQGLAKLLGATGPVAIQEWPEPLNSDNFVRIALNEAYIRFPEKPGRVDFLIGAGRQIWERLLSSQTTDVRSLTSAVGESFSSKHMRIWSRHEGSELKRLNVDGGLKPRGSRDYLYLVGQNVAANKLDYYGHRTINYAVEVAADGRIFSRAGVRLENRTPARALPRYITGLDPLLSYPAGLNKSYLSFYLGGNTLAAGAKVNGRPTQTESHLEQGHSVISKVIDAMPGESSELELNLQPAPQKPGEYRLLVQHQPGVRPDVLNLSVRLPEGAVVERATPGMQAANGTLTWRGKLTSDREFYVKFRPSGGVGLRGQIERLLS